MTGFSCDAQVVARKPHTCDQCRTVINPGETYLRCAWSSFGDFGHSKEHQDCRKAWSKLAFDVMDYDNWEGAPFLCDLEDVTEYEHEWLAIHFPAVALRFGWYLPS